MPRHEVRAHHPPVSTALGLAPVTRRESRVTMMLGNAANVAMLSVLVTGAATGQVTARQGEETTQSEYRSPMFLEAPLPGRWDGVVRFGDFTRYVCDGIALPLIEVTSTPKTTTGGDQTLKFWVQNRTDQDKWVSLVLELVQNQKVIRRVVRAEIDAESNKVVWRTLQWPILREHLEATVRPILRVKVSVRDD
jgi:hypothetical protein